MQAARTGNVSADQGKAHEDETVRHHYRRRPPPQSLAGTKRRLHFESSARASRSAASATKPRSATPEPLNSSISAQRRSLLREINVRPPPESFAEFLGKGAALDGCGGVELLTATLAQVHLPQLRHTAASGSGRSALQFCAGK